MKLLATCLISIATLVSSAAEPAFLTQDEAQAKFDAAVAAADEMIVAPIYGAGVVDVPILKSSDPQDIRKLSSEFRFSIVIEKRIIDGEEQEFIRSFVCGCYGQFQLTLRKKERPLLSLRLFHGKSVYCEDLSKDSQIEIDQAALAELYLRLQTLASEAQKERANQSAETTAVECPPSNHGSLPAVSHL